MVLAGPLCALGGSASTKMRKWGAQLTSAQIDTIKRLASAEIDLLLSDTHQLTDEPPTSSYPLLHLASERCLRIFQQREELEGVCALLLEIGDAVEIRQGLETLDNAGKELVERNHTLFPVLDAWEMARRGAGVQPGWWNDWAADFIPVVLEEERYALEQMHAVCANANAALAALRELCGKGRISVRRFRR